jgi:hypothetical protein
MTRQLVSGVLALLLGVGIAVNAVLGPLILDVIRLRTSEGAETQFVGGEVVSLGLVVPLLLVSGVLWLRGNRLAPALAIGPALYAIYTYITAVAGQEYGRYDGNVERFFPLYAALVAGGAALAVRSGVELAAGDVPAPAERLSRTAAWMLIAIGAFFALAWAAQIGQVLTGAPTAEYAESPTLFWLIKLLDLAFVIPAFITTGVGLLRQQPWAARAAVAMMAFATCIGSAVAAMSIAMELSGDPASEPVMLVVVVPMAVAFAMVTWRLLAAVVTSSTEPGTRRLAPRGPWLMGSHHAR